MDGSAWNTQPPDTAMSHMWLSCRKMPAASLVRKGVGCTAGSTRHPVAGVQSSPDFPPSPPDHDPPSVKTLPLDSVTAEL